MFTTETSLVLSIITHYANPHKTRLRSRQTGVVAKTEALESLIVASMWIPFLTSMYILPSICHAVAKQTFTGLVSMATIMPIRWLL